MAGATAIPNANSGLSWAQVSGTRAIRPMSTDWFAPRHMAALERATIWPAKSQSPELIA